MADFLGYLTSFVTDNAITVPLHDTANGIHAGEIMLASVGYRTRLTPLATGAIHDADGTQRSKFDVAQVEHVMVIKKASTAAVAEFWQNRVLAAAGYAGTVTKTNLATGTTAAARARLQSAEVLEPKQIIDNLLKVALYFEFVTWF